jgi:radical SAM superfamily enzyme YgiQ (UPF0313 family)
MKILFCQAITYPFIGIMSLSAVLRQHSHETRLKIMNIKNPNKKDIDGIVDYNPDIVAFPVYTGWHGTVVGFCKKLKEKTNVITVLGGPHPSYYPKVIENEGIDFICIGEGEESFVQLVNNLQHGYSTGNIPGMWFKKSNKVINTGSSNLPNLQQLPPMDIDLYCNASSFIKNLNHREFSLNRGCPFKCTYCNEPSINKLYENKSLRSKSPEQSIEEILYVYDKYAFDSIAFTSDNLFLNKSFASEFLEKYKAKINIPFYCQMRLEFITPEVAHLLKEANCFFLIIGIESGSFRVRREILDRKMSNELIVKACSYLKDANIKINTNNMMGIPGETVEEVWETVKLNQKIKPTTSWCSIFQPYPGTRLTDKLLSNGEITDDTFDHIPQSYFEKSVLKNSNIHYFVNLHRFFYFAVKYPSLNPIIKFLCKYKVSHLYDIFFLLSFYFYLKKSYKKSTWNATKTIMINLIETFKG